MGLKMKSFNITVVRCKIRFLGGRVGTKKTIYKGEVPEKGFDSLQI